MGIFSLICVFIELTVYQILVLFLFIDKKLKKKQGVKQRFYLQNNLLIFTNKFLLEHLYMYNQKVYIIKTLNTGCHKKHYETV